MNPNSSNQFLYLRAIQGHSGDTAIDPELQDIVLLPEGFTEHIYDVGNASEMNSIIRSGLIPGGRSLKRGRQSVFFIVTNPMEDIMVWEKRHATWPSQGSRHTRILGNFFFKLLYFGCNLKFAQEKGLHFYQTRSHAVVFYSTLLAACSEKAACMKTQEEPYQKVRLTHDCHGLHPNRTRNAVNKINEAKTPDHLGTHQAIRRVTGKPGTTPWTTEFLAYHSRQLNSRIQHVKTM